MEKYFEISLLLDFYSNMITKRQREILDMHFNKDYSLAEISEQLQISRQGVYDNIKKGKMLLINFEEKIGLLKKYYVRKENIELVINEIEKLNGVNPEWVKKIKEILNNIIE